MKLSKREDISAPVGGVYRALIDYPVYERAALRRDIAVTRLDDRAEFGPDMTWQITIGFRGRPHDVTLRVAEVTEGSRIRLAADSGGLMADVVIELLTVSQGRTRMVVGTDLRAVTMSSKLLLQSLKLAKGSLDKRFAKRVTDFARDIEAREARQTRRA